MKTYRRLLQFLKPYIWPYFVLAMICMVAFGATDGSIPFLVQPIMDDVFGKRDQAMLNLIPFLVIGLFAFGAVVLLAYTYPFKYWGDFTIVTLRQR